MDDLTIKTHWALQFLKIKCLQITDKKYKWGLMHFNGKIIHLISSFFTIERIQIY